MYVRITRKHFERDMEVTSNPRFTSMTKFKRILKNCGFTYEGKKMVRVEG